MFTCVSEHRVTQKPQKSSKASSSSSVGGTGFSASIAQEIGRTEADLVSEKSPSLSAQRGKYLFLSSSSERVYFPLSLQGGFNSVRHSLPPAVLLCYILEVHTSSIIFNDLFGIFQPDRNQQSGTFLRISHSLSVKDILKDKVNDDLTDADHFYVNNI